MKVLMRVVIPPAVLAAPGTGTQWGTLLKSIGALATRPREEGRIQQVLLDIEPHQITPIAEQVFRLVGVKPEFLPEVAPPPYYGVRNY